MTSKWGHARLGAAKEGPRDASEGANHEGGEMGVGRAGGPGGRAGGAQPPSRGRCLRVLCSGRSLGGRVA